MRALYPEGLSKGWFRTHWAPSGNISARTAIQTEKSQNLNLLNCIKIFTNNTHVLLWQYMRCKIFGDGNDWDFGIVQDEYTFQDDKALMCTWTLPPLQHGLDSCSCCSSCQSMRSRVYIVTKSAGFASRITQLPPLTSYSGFMFINITGGSQKLIVPPSTS